MTEMSGIEDVQKLAAVSSRIAARPSYVRWVVKLVAIALAKRCSSAGACFASSSEANLLGGKANDAPLEEGQFNGLASPQPLFASSLIRHSPTERADRPRSRRKDQGFSTSHADGVSA